MDSSSSSFPGTQAPTLPGADGSAGRLPSALRIGSYTICEVLGEGSMGVVYRAVQDRPQRVVALKVIRAGGASEEALRRFDQETHILGRLQHPGIAQIFEAGVADSEYGLQPFFAMELIQGVALFRYAQMQRLDPKALLRLVGKLCEAVQHAHQQGVVHRDLKPGNILVDESGQPKILDFGIAIAADRNTPDPAKQAKREQVVGTIPYMSLEQLRGDPHGIDTRTDVYALGVIAYQLLAHRLPYDLRGKSAAQAVGIVEECGPTRLRDVNRALPSDIEAIVHKALERDKTRRYQSASDLGEDIRRYLANEPVLAHPPSIIYQFNKFAKRNMTLVAGVTTVFVSLVLGLLGTSMSMYEARHQQRQAEDSARVKQKLTEFWGALLDEAAPDKALGHDVTVREALSSAAAEIQGKFADDPLVEASIRKAVGTAFVTLGDLDAAEPQLVAAAESYRATRGEEHRDTLEAVAALVDLYRHQGRYSDAERLQLRTCEITSRVFGEDDPIALKASSELAHLYHVQGRLRDAERLYRRVLQAQRDRLGDENADTMETMDNLASLLRATGRLTEAGSSYRTALNAQRRLLGEDHPSTLASTNSLAHLLTRQGKLQQAQNLYQETLEARRRVLGPDHPDTLSTMSNLATLLRRMGRLAEAEQLYNQVLEGRHRELGDEHPKTLSLRINLAGLRQEQGDLAGAEKLYRETTRTLRAKLGDHHPITITSIFGLGALLVDKGAYNEAESLLREALSLRREVLPPKHPDIADSLLRLGTVLLHEGDPAAAEPFLRECVEIRQNSLPQGDWHVANAQSRLGECLTALERFEEAEPLVVDSYPIILDRWGDSDERTKRALCRIEALYDAWGRHGAMDISSDARERHERRIELRP